MKATEKTFKEYLKEKLEKPSINRDYDPNGNSARAEVSRGLFKEILYQYKKYPKSFMHDIKCFEGFETPIGYFIGLPLKVILSPLLPIFLGIYSYKGARDCYLEEFKKQKENKQ